MGEKLTKRQQRIVRDNPDARRLLAAAQFDEDGCWYWRGSKGSASYAYIRLAGKTVRAHRASYTFFSGPIPDGLSVCHHCDHPSCVNPHHLFLGSRKDNARDMVRKGRGARQIDATQSHFRSGSAPDGERGSGAKLTEAQALEIISKRRGGVKTKALAQQYGVDRTTIQRLMRGQNWKRLTGRAALSSHGGGE